MVKVSSTKLGVWLRCRRKYWYRYVEGLRRIVKPVTLQRGTIIHSCLEAHYKGHDWKAVLQKWINEVDSKLVPFMNEREQAEWAELPREIYRIVLGYIKAYEAHDRGFEVLGVEESGDVRLPSGNLLTYRIDRVLREKGTGLLFILDTKTVSDIPTESVRFQDVQTALYLWAYGEATGKEVAGIIWDYVRTKAPRIPPLLKNGSMSRAAIDTDWPTYRAALLKAGLDPKDYEDMRDKLSDKVFYRRVKQARPVDLVANLVREADYTAKQIDMVHAVLDSGKKTMFPRNLLKTCSWDCEFHELCMAQLAGQSGEMIIDSKFTRDSEITVDISGEEEDD